MLLLNKLKEEKKMKKVLNSFTKVAKKSAERALKRDANSTTCWSVYQPKAPAALSKFKKHNEK